MRSLIHSPEAVIHSPAEIVAVWPTTVTRSRCPRAFARRTQKPFSELWKVTCSTRPTRTSCGDDCGCVFMCGVKSAFETDDYTMAAKGLTGITLTEVVVHSGTRR